jgi:acetyl-CoA synthetase
VLDGSVQTDANPTWAPIGKPEPARAGANLTDYERTCREFSWPAARNRLAGLPGGRGLNIAYEAVDRHLTNGNADVVALRCVDRHDNVTISYAELAKRTNRFANLLGALGVRPGERVFTLLGRVPDLYVAALGT